MDWAEGTKVRINCGTRALWLQSMGLGFRVFDVGRIGMYGDTEWLSGTGSYLEKRV